MHAILSAIALGLLLHHAYAQPFPYQLVHEVNCKQTFINQYRNVIKMCAVAVDEARGLAYTTGSQTRYASIIDVAQRREIGSVTMPFTPQTNSLRCNPVNGYLLAGISDGKTLYAVNPRTSENTGSYTFDTQLTGLAMYAPSNTMFACDGNAVKVLDGNTLSPIGSFNTGMRNGGIALDSAADILYVVSRNLTGPNITVKTFRAAAPNPLLRTITIPSTSALGEIFLDPAADRMVLVGLTVAKAVRISSGTVESTIDIKTVTQASAYSASLQKLFLDDEDGYSDAGEHGSWGKIYSYSFGTGSLDSMKRGNRPSRIALDDSRHVLVIPSMHSATVELVDLLTNHADTIDIGETADAFALSPNHRTLYIAKRLGGSSIVMYDKTTQVLSQMPSGNWPAVTEVDSVLQRLFVLNEYESSISVFDTRTNTLLKTILLSPPEARTDAIPTMYLDQTTHKLYVGIPEFGTITLVDARTMAEEKTIGLPGFQFNRDIHFSIGVFQLMTAPAYTSLFVLQKVEQKFVVLDMSTLSFIDSVNVHPKWPVGSSFESNLLQYDTKANLLFLGNRVLNPQTLAQVGTIPSTDRLLGYSHDRKILYTISATAGTVKVHEHHPVTYAEVYSQELFQQEGQAAPVFYFDSQTEEFYISEFNFAVLKHYYLNRTVRVPPFLLAETQLDFGTVPRGQSSTRILILRNTGGTALEISGMSISAGDFSIESGGGARTIPEGDSLRIDLKFQPKDIGDLVGTLTIESDASNGSPVIVALRGAGIPPPFPRISLSRTVLDFGPVSSPAEQSMVISSIGAADLTISNQSLAGPNAGEYEIRQYAGSPIRAGDSSIVIIRFIPTGSGTKSATFHFETNDPGLPSVEVGLVATAIVVGVEQPAVADCDVILSRNYPNPFNPTTTIEYTLLHAATVELQVAGFNGRRVRTISSGQQERGMHHLLFDASGLPTGIYYALLRVVTRSGETHRSVTLIYVK